MISQTIEYALRAMSNIASLRGIATTSECIAAAMGIPQAYLSKVMRDLVRAELVKSFRGPHGGFVLARSAGDISLLDIVNAVDPLRRTASGHLDVGTHAPLHRCMDEVYAHVEERLRRTSLDSVLEDSTAPPSPAQCDRPKAKAPTEAA